MRAYKTVNDSYIEPISFTVPRRAETFQSDIFPPAIGLKPAMSAKEWFSGKTALPPKIDLESVYDGNAPVEVPADYKPPAAAAAPAPAPVAKPAPKKEPEPEPVAARAPPNMTDQKQSMSAMANKYQDDDEEDEDEADETSSFEEVSRPQPRGSMPVREQKPPSPIKATPPVQVKQSSPIKTQPVQSPVSARTPISPAAAPSSGSSSSVEASLDQIKQLLEAQTKIIQAQNEKIGQLVADVDILKKRASSGSQDQNERIRQLELELEEARS